MKRRNIDIKQACVLILIFIIAVFTIYMYNNTHIKSLSLDNDAFSEINDNYHVSYNDKQEIVSVLDQRLLEAQKAMEDKLSQMTLADVKKDVDMYIEQEQ